MKNIFQFAKKPGYTILFVVIAIAAAWLYIGPLTNQQEYHTLEWVFAILFPLLLGLIVANQVYNLREVKTCPTSATSGGVIGGIAGLTTVACPACLL